MFRVRYDDQQRDLTLAPLNVLQSNLTVIWAAFQGNLALFVDARNRALLQRALEALPLLRLEKASFDPTELGRPIPLAFADMLPGKPHLLALALERGAVRLTWRDGILNYDVFAPQEQVKQVLAEAWPRAEALVGVQKWLKANFGRNGIKVPPSKIALPGVASSPTLASRNKTLVVSTSSSGAGLPFASQEIDDRPVRLPVPLRTAWIGLTSAVPPAIRRVIDEWLEDEKRDIIVLDQRGWSTRWKTDCTVSWLNPGQGERINPLSPIGVDDAGAYADLVLEWLSALAVNETTVGTPVYRLLRVILKIWGYSSMKVEGQPLSPPIVSSILDRPDLTEQLPLPSSLLTKEEQMVWETRSWTSAEANLMPAAARLDGLLSQPKLSVLWFPCFAEEITARRLTVLAPGTTRAIRAFVTSCWLPLRHRLSPSTLVVALGTETLGERVLADTRAKGASALLWGETLQKCAGAASNLDGVDLLVSRSPDAPALAQRVGVPFQNLLAQADEQVVAWIGGQLSTVLLRSPAEEVVSEHPTAISWEELTDLGSLVVVGPADGAFAFFQALAAHRRQAGEEILFISGNGSSPAPPDVPQRDVPTLNPFYPRSLPRWLWWTQLVGLPEVLMRQAWARGAASLHELASLAEGESGVRVKQLVRSGRFERGAIDPASALKGSFTLNCDEPAVIYALIAACLEANRPLFLWRPGITLSPTLLKRLQVVVYAPDTSPSCTDLPTLLILGDGPGVPVEYRRVARRLRKNEGMLVRHRNEVRHVQLPQQTGVHDPNNLGQIADTRPGEHRL